MPRGGGETKTDGGGCVGRGARAVWGNNRIFLKRGCVRQKGGGGREKNMGGHQFRYLFFAKKKKKNTVIVSYMDRIYSVFTPSDKNCIIPDL